MSSRAGWTPTCAAPTRYGRLTRFGRVRLREAARALRVLLDRNCRVRRSVPPRPRQPPMIRRHRCKERRMAETGLEKSPPTGKSSGRGLCCSARFPPCRGSGMPSANSCVPAHSVVRQVARSRSTYASPRVGVGGPSGRVEIDRCAVRGAAAIDTGICHRLHTPWLSGGGRR